MAKTGPKNNHKLTQAVVRKLEDAFAIDASVGEACFYADISRDTYYRWIKENPELSDKFARLRIKPILTARRVIFDNLSKNYKVAMWYLERKKKDEFSLRSEFTGANGKDLMPDRKDQIKRALESIL